MKTKFREYEIAVKAALPPGGSASFEPYEGSDELEISELCADQPGNGWGTQAMEIITQLADKHRVGLMIIPAGITKQAAERLTEFYERFGFEGEDALHREPNP